MAVWVCNACVCVDLVSTCALARGRVGGPCPLISPSWEPLGPLSPAPTSISYRNWFPWLGKCLHPAQPGARLPRGAKPDSSAATRTPGAQGQRAAPQPLGLSSLFWLSHKPETFHLTEPTTARDQKFGEPALVGGSLI